MPAAIKRKREPVPASPVTLLAIKLGLSLFCALLLYMTLWYARAVEYDVENFIHRPYQCIESAFRRHFQSPSYAFFIDKLTLLGSVRAGAVLFWDDAVDISIVAPSPSPSSSFSRSVAEIKKLRDAAAECNFTLSERIVQSAARGTERQTWHLEPQAQTLAAAAPSVFLADPQARNHIGFHVRFCHKNDTTATIICPMLHASAPRDDDAIPASHVLPLKACVISMVETHCPANVDQLLEDEFGKEWKTRNILDFAN